jgi:hypothetical protein
MFVIDKRDFTVPEYQEVAIAQSISLAPILDREW